MPLNLLPPQRSGPLFERSTVVAIGRKGADRLLIRGHGALQVASLGEKFRVADEHKRRARCKA